MSRIKDAEHHAILIDLDSLLDTRLGTIALINQTAALNLINAPEYYHRCTNDFSKICGISKEFFDELFAARDNTTLQNSLLTNCVFALRALIDGLAKQHRNTPFSQQVRLVVNTYPYTLTTDEIDDMRKSVGLYTGLGAERIDTVRLSWEELTPTLIKDHYTGMILYNYCTWMETQQEAFLKKRITSVVVFAPALYKDREPGPNDPRPPGSEGLSFFDLTEGFLIGCYSLTFLDVSCFSIIPPAELMRSVALRPEA